MGRKRNLSKARVSIPPLNRPNHTTSRSNPEEISPPGTIAFVRTPLGGDVRTKESIEGPRSFFLSSSTLLVRSPSVIDFAYFFSSSPGRSSPRKVSSGSTNLENPLSDCPAPDSGCLEGRNGEGEVGSNG